MFNEKEREQIHECFSQLKENKMYIKAKVVSASQQRERDTRKLTNPKIITYEIDVESNHIKGYLSISTGAHKWYVGDNVMITIEREDE